MLARTIPPLFVVVVVACGGSQSGAQSADDVDSAEGGAGKGSLGAVTLAEGTQICINRVLGMRYPLEDALREYDLEPVRHCTLADVMLEEGGAPGNFFMRYQMVGDSDWQRCESSVDSRMEFVEECTAKMVRELGNSDSE